MPSTLLPSPLQKENVYLGRTPGRNWHKLIICQCEILYNRETGSCTVPSILPGSPFGPFAGSWSPSLITCHGDLIGRVSNDQGLLGLWPGLLPQAPSPGVVRALPCPAQVALCSCPPVGRWMSCRFPFLRPSFNKRRVTSPGSQRGRQLRLVCIPH